MTERDTRSTVPHRSDTSSNSGGGYEVIARRYRPRFFQEVVGQEAVSEALQQAIVQERLGHAYLFCGPRGVGKTSMARIFARALQCPETRDGVPCDQCSTCDRIFRGEDADVLEMDGASHRGIDDIRELIQHVRYAPSGGPYRIFIIDEVHMLTREAFNSLLKTLEEPPPHVKFVFATTEPEKVLPTVLSRCQRCDFASIAPVDIVKRLGQICELEGAAPEEGVLVQIADLARGGMRDSQSLLDQLLSFAGETPTMEDLDGITGRISRAQLEKLVAVSVAGATAEMIELLGAALAGGTDPSVLLEQVVEYLREQLHQGVAGDWGDVEIEGNLLAQEILQQARQRMRRIDRADIVLELALMRIGTLGDLVRLSDLIGEGPLPPRGEAGAVEITASNAAEPVPSVGEPPPSPAPARPKSESPAAAVETRGERLRRGLEEKEKAKVTVEKPKAAAKKAQDSGDVKDSLHRELAEDSPIVARRLRLEGDLQEGGGKLRLSLSPALNEVLNSECRGAFERWKKNCPMEVEVKIETRLKRDSSASELVAPLAEEQDPPGIVSRAREIFHGDLFDGGQRGTQRKQKRDGSQGVAEGEEE